MVEVLFSLTNGFEFVFCECSRVIWYSFMVFMVPFGSCGDCSMWYVQHPVPRRCTVRVTVGAHKCIKCHCSIFGSCGSGRNCEIINLFNSEFVLE